MTPPPPAILPVTVQYAAASEQFAYIVKSSGDPTEYLLMIDQAMKSRPGPKLGA